MRIKTVLTKTFNIWLGLIYRTKIQEKDLVKRLNSQELLSWPCLQRKETELVFIQTLQFILVSLFLRDCCFVEVNARSVACSQPPGRSVCEGMGRVDCKVFWGVPACLSQSLLALPATQKAEFPLAPELPGTCACWSPVWGLPGRAPSSTHSFYIAADWAKACYFCARYTEDRGLAVGHTSLESRWKRLCDPESWVIRLKCRTGSTAAQALGVGQCPEENGTSGSSRWALQTCFSPSSSHMKWIWIHTWWNWSFLFTLQLVILIFLKCILKILTGSLRMYFVGTAVFRTMSWV